MSISLRNTANLTCKRTARWRGIVLRMNNNLVVAGISLTWWLITRWWLGSKKSSRCITGRVTNYGGEGKELQLYSTSNALSRDSWTTCFQSNSDFRVQMGSNCDCKHFLRYVGNTTFSFRVHCLSFSKLIIWFLWQNLSRHPSEVQ